MDGIWKLFDSPVYKSSSCLTQDVTNHKALMNL